MWFKSLIAPCMKCDFPIHESQCDRNTHTHLSVQDSCTCTESIIKSIPLILQAFNQYLSKTSTKKDCEFLEYQEEESYS